MSLSLLSMTLSKGADCPYPYSKSNRQCRLCPRTQSAGRLIAHAKDSEEKYCMPTVRPGVWVYDISIAEVHQRHLANKDIS